MSTEDSIFTVTAYRLEWLLAKVAKLNKKAVKLGTPEISVTVLSTGTRERKTGNLDYQGNAIKVVETIHEVQVVGDAPVIAGWQFVATLEHLNEGTLLRRVPTIEDVDLTAYRNASPSDCDHCKMDRRRNNTFVVRNVETGELKQVGSSCLRDFLGHMAPEQYAAFAQALSSMIEEFGYSDMDDEDRDYEGGMRSGRYGVNIVDFLTVVNAFIDLNGWVSGGAAWTNGGVSTATCAMHDFFSKPEQRIKTTEADKEMALKVIEWASNLSEADTAKNDYLHNLRVSVGETVVYWSTKGIVGSAVQAYRKHVEKLIVERKARENKTNDFVGEVGKRETFTVTVMNVHITSGYYDTVYIYKLEDQTGNKLTWFASNDKLEQGKSYNLKATVKKHEASEQYGKSTVITRAKIEEVL